MIRALRNYGAKYNHCMGMRGLHRGRDCEKKSVNVN